MVDHVWFVLIRHQHGEDIYIHQTEDGAWQTLSAYVDENWCEPVFQGNPPTDPEEKIETYFDRMSYDEFYEIEHLEVGP